MESSLDCELHAVEHLPELIPGGATIVCQDGELRCSASGSRLFIAVDGMSVSIVALEAHRLQVYVSSARVGSTWSIQHFAILPLVLELLRLRGLYPIHAAALEWQGQGIILPAQPGGGKSTLAIALLRAGLRLLSDDMPLLSKQHERPVVLAFPEDINVCEDGIGFFSELAFLSRQEANERGKRSFDAQYVFTDQMAECAAPRLLVFPRIGRTLHSVLRPIGHGEATVQLLQHSLPPMHRPLAAAHFETMLDTVACCDCYQLETGVDPNEAAQQLKELL